MKIGSLIRIQHFGKWNGKIGFITWVVKRAGFVDSYSIRIPSFKYEIGLTREQCEVLCEGK